MISGFLRYVAAVSSIIGFAGALGLGVAQSSVHAQTTASVLKTSAAVTFEPAPKVLTGTLFNTIEQRQRLDRVRRRGGVLEDEVIALDAVEPERSVINGFVKRSDGRNTVWVDDVMKRDPRSEVVEQLEPNVVGRSNGISTRLLTSTPELRGIIRKQAVVKAKTKGRSQKNSRRSARSKLKLL